MDWRPNCALFCRSAIALQLTARGYFWPPKALQAPQRFQTEPRPASCLLVRPRLVWYSPPVAGRFMTLLAGAFLFEIVVNGIHVSQFDWLPRRISASRRAPPRFLCRGLLQVQIQTFLPLLTFATVLRVLSLPKHFVEILDSVRLITIWGFWRRRNLRLRLLFSSVFWHLLLCRDYY